MKKNRLFALLIVLGLLTACSPSSDSPEKNSADVPINTPPAVSPTPFLPMESLTTEQEVPTVVENEKKDELPETVQGGLKELWPTDLTIASENTECAIEIGKNGLQVGKYVLALAAPVNTVIDEITFAEMLSYMQGDAENGFISKLLISENDLVLIEKAWDLETSRFMVSDYRDMAENAYQIDRTWAVLPFDQLTPDWKVIRVDGISPYDQDFDIDAYPLTVVLELICGEEKDLALFEERGFSVWTNRDGNKFTSVLLTGTTALTRATAYRMEINGMTYPGEVIKPWFDEADISHISSEVSFSETCPRADPNQQDLSFCGRPEYAELFTYIGVDVIELSGNHLADKGVDLLVKTLNQLADLGIPYYAAGFNREEAKEPLLIEHNGNQIAFIGCNSAGPGFVFATPTRAGVLSCNMDEMAALVAAIRESGYLPIVTFQYAESYQFDPMPWQRNDFRRMAESGAVIVSGSQAHLPMTMEVYQGSFIHYGLGNLFFDQMDIPVKGTRREFLDRHIFYEGRYLGVDLLTAMLEDYSQPRPMTGPERESLLQDAFKYFSRD